MLDDFDDCNEATRLYCSRWLVSPQTAERHLQIRTAIHACGEVVPAKLAALTGLPLAVIESDLRFFEMQARVEEQDDEFLRLHKRQG
jgi:hypothetical protein